MKVIIRRLERYELSINRTRNAEKVLKKLFFDTYSNIFFPANDLL